MNRTILFCLIAGSLILTAHGDSKVFIPRMRTEKKVADAPPPPAPPQPQPAPPPVEEAVFLELPAQVDGEAGSFIKIQAKTNGTHVRWVPMDKNLAVFPGEMLKDSTATVVMSTVAGQYRLIAYTALNDMPSDPVITMVVVHGPQPPPVPPPQPQPTPQPVPVPPPQPVPPPAPNPVATRLSIVIVDNVLNRDVRTMAIMNDISFWNAVRAQGHSVFFVNTTQPDAIKYKTQVDTNGGVPCIVIMDAAKTDHNWLNQNPDDLKLPASTAGIQNLINRYSGKAASPSPASKYAAR